MLSLSTLNIGNLSLLAAFFLALYGALIGLYGAVRKDRRCFRSALNALFLVPAFGFFSLASLASAFLRHDYSNAYVWRTSNNEMSALYLISAVWGGMDGSLLLWAWMLSLFAALALIRPVGAERLLRWTVPVLHSASAFFFGLVSFLTNPFRPIPSAVIPGDGNGLNPLLQNPSMMIHPPCLYAGFTGLVVPFAFALATLCGGPISWIAAARRPLIVAWGFLTAGIVLGGNWAYIELGWGGFWAWDPVENASFLPWLSATALLHSAMVEERRGMLRMWNIVLAILSYLLAVFGTFLTRSGIVQSVHAFAQSDIGWVFLVYIGVVTFLTALLLLLRARQFAPDRRIEGLLSRETAFLFNNLLLLTISFATFWGVMYPVFSEAVFGEKVAVGPPFFNRVNTPLFLLLLFLMGVGQLLAWKRTTWGGFCRTAAIPFVIASGAVLFGMYFAVDQPSAAVAFGLSLFVLLVIIGEYRRALSARRMLGVAGGIGTLIRSRPRWVGGLCVHGGVAVMAISIAASMGFKIERDVVLGVGQTEVVGPYSLTLEGLSEREEANYTAVLSRVRVADRAGALLGELRPERRWYRRNDEVTTEVDIRITPRDDLYLALAGLSDPGNAPKAVLKVFVNPLQMWLWVGAAVVLLGTAVLLLPRSLPVRAAVAEENQVVTV